VIRISRDNRDCSAVIRLPASKSISNRLLILQFFYGNSFRINNLSNADDTVLLSSLLDLIRHHQLRGDSGLLRVDARNAGTVMRFLVPLLSVTRGHYLLTGNDRMKQRPIAGLVDAMQETGAEIDYLEDIGYPPLLIRGRAITGRRISLDSSVSSQFITALLLLAPTLEEGLTIELSGKPVSWPYIKMTTGLLTSLGVNVIVQENAIRVYNKKEIKAEVDVEPDWSAASFWYAMLSMAEKGEVSFPGLRKSGLQGDQQVSIFFAELGIDTIENKNGIRIVRRKKINDNFYADFTGFPDLALPVILSCAVAGIRATFTGLERLRIKESDRIVAISDGLSKIGITLREEFPGTWRLSGRLIEPGEIDIQDFDDHRVAMTFASLAMKGFTVNFENPEVVNKSYPGFWKALESSGFNCNSPVDKI
jgi:3-phosphoshikimate 1-carboxyvinyltransferase